MNLTPIKLGCSRVGAGWCLIHGVCSCPDTGCTLHAEHTDHGERGGDFAPATLGRYWRIRYDAPHTAGLLTSALLTPVAVTAHLGLLDAAGYATNVRVEETVVTQTTRVVPVDLFRGG